MASETRAARPHTMQTFTPSRAARAGVDPYAGLASVMALGALESLRLGLFAYTAAAPEGGSIAPLTPFVTLVPVAYLIPAWFLVAGLAFQLVWAAIPDEVGPWEVLGATGTVLAPMAAATGVACLGGCLEWPPWVGQVALVAGCVGTLVTTAWLWRRGLGVSWVRAVLGGALPMVVVLAALVAMVHFGSMRATTCGLGGFGPWELLR